VVLVVVVMVVVAAAAPNFAVNLSMDVAAQNMQCSEGLQYHHYYCSGLCKKCNLQIG
jgi:hypothetical protein